VLENYASEGTLCSQAATSKLEHLGYGVGVMTPKLQLPQEEKIKQLGNVYLNPVTSTKDLNRFELPHSAVADGSAAHTTSGHFQKQVGEWCACKFCGKCYSDQKKLATHQRKDCGNGPGYECPYCCVTIRRKGNLLRHIRTFHT
jgi:uncharacterized Zn-finger protein